MTIRNDADLKVKTSENELISVESLSMLTGFPEDFIKSELLVDEQLLTMAELRVKMADYLESFGGSN